jgi:Protein tyrosine and serine/threonine kinase
VVKFILCLQITHPIRRYRIFHQTRESKCYILFVLPIFIIIALHSFSPKTSTQAYGSGELIVVGAFDTTQANSQVTYCSVGKWNGIELSKVGEGLCNSALSKGMKITTASLAGPQDVYVAGSFMTQVWNGERHEFVKIFNIAHFNAVEQVWLPLNIGQITCSWCTVTVLALAWDSKRRQLHVAGKFNAIDGRNVPSGLAIYDRDSGHLVAHPGGGLSMTNRTQDGVGTALQLDEDAGVLYVMGSFERLTNTNEICYGLAAYEINANRWTCLADASHTVQPTGGGNMLLTPYGLMVAGKTTTSTTWPDTSRPYTIALLKATLKTRSTMYQQEDDLRSEEYDSIDPIHDFNWSWLPGFEGHDEPLHALSNGFGDYSGNVFIAGDNLVARWYHKKVSDSNDETKSTPLSVFGHASSTASSNTIPFYAPTTENLSGEHVRGAIMAISQMMPEPDQEPPKPTESLNYTIVIYCVALGTIIGMVTAVMFNRNVSSAIVSIFAKDAQLKGISLDTLTYGALEHSSITEAYKRAMQTRHVQHPHLLTLIDPQEIFLQRIIGEGTFGRVWSAKWRSAKVAVKEFVFAQAAVAGKSAMQREIIEEIIGEAGMMAILRHPNVLQLFGCSLTAQAIWIVSELCSLGSLRQVLDDQEKILPLDLRLSLALQVAEGMTYLHNQDPPIIHRDLKSHNIFIHETFTERDNGSFRSITKSMDSKVEGHPHLGLSIRFSLDDDHKMETESTIIAKIGDWGSARATLSGSRTMTHGVGTACWLAPEVIKHARSSKFSDVYSFGIVLWELATREEVYQGLETTQIIAKVANESLRPPIPHDCPWKEIMVRCWEENPMDRLEFDEIVDMFNIVMTRLSTEQNSQFTHRCVED